MSAATDAGGRGSTAWARLQSVPWGPGQIGTQSYALLVSTVAAQLSTILITWPLWQVRSEPPNLPVFDVPQIGFGPLLVGSLLYLLLDPRRGWVVHVGLVIAASVFDQFRMQPQIPAMIVLMMATVFRPGLLICRWFLSALWLWAGLHKFLSPDWFAHSSYWILEQLSFGHEAALEIQPLFAMAVAGGEMLLGLLAIGRPRWAALFCPILHLSIAIMLVLIRWNFSVLPWNLAIALTGTWVLWSVPTVLAERRAKGKGRRLEGSAAVLLLTTPIGFYFGVVDRAYAHVLYSDLVPKSLITGPDRLRPVTAWLKQDGETDAMPGQPAIHGWRDVHAPFPCERRMHRQYFLLTSKAGDKLHLFDPRPALADQFFIMADSGGLKEISEEEFFDGQDQISGVAMDDRRAKFWLRQTGVIKQRWYRNRMDDPSQLVSYAYTLRPPEYSRQALELLAGLPNLEQLQLKDCPVSDEDLRLIARLKRLTFIGLSNTSVTDAGLVHLAKLPQLQLLEVDNTRISPEGLERLQESLGY